MSLLTITLHQPYASLLVAGVKTIETRTGPPAGDMRPDGVRPEPGFAINRGDRIGIHAGKGWAPGWRGWYDPEEWQAEVLASLDADLNEDVNGSGMVKLDRYSLPLGALIGTARVVDAVPINQFPARPMQPNVYTVGGKLTLRRSAITVWPEDIEDQRPYGIWTPGRWAWLLDDIKPTTERCPACWGQGTPHAPLSVESDRIGSRVCRACNGDAKCPPIPAKGKQGVWRWEP